MKERPHGFKVRFDGERVGVQVKLKSRGDGTYQLKVDGRSGQCGGKHDDGEGKDAQKHRDDHGSKGAKGDKGDKGRSSERHGDRRRRRLAARRGSLTLVPPGGARVTAVRPRAPTHA